MSVTVKDRADSMFLSRQQVHQFVDLMHQVHWVVEELDTTLTRQTQFTNPYEAGKSVETPVVFHESASDAAFDLHGTLLSWVTAVCDQRQVPHPGMQRSVQLAQWMSRNVGHLAVMEDAEDCLDELVDAVKRCVRIVDRPVGRIYVGPCGDESETGRCGADLYASPLKPEVKCRECGAVHEVEKRRKVLQEQVRNLLGTASEIARLLPWIMNSAVTRKRITYYANRGSVSKREINGVTMYQIGEVIDAHVDFESRKAHVA